MRVSNDFDHAGQDRHFLWRALGVAAGDHDLGWGVLAMKAADGGASLLVGGGGYSASIDYYNSGFGWLVGPLQASFQQLAFDGSTIRLGSAAAEI